MSVNAEAVREQVTDAIKRANRTPTHFLSTPDISFSENETAHSSLILDDTVNGEDDCVHLPRALTELVSRTEFPSIRAEANDSLQLALRYLFWPRIPSRHPCRFNTQRSPQPSATRSHTYQAHQH
jgi:hypothetical protein